MNAVFNFIKKNALLLLAIVFAIAVSVGVVSAKYVHTDTVADDLTLIINKDDGTGCTIDKEKLWTALKGLSYPKPSALKFVKGSDVPTDATLQTARIQTDDSLGEIGVYRSADNATVYIAPIGGSDVVMYAPQDCNSFLAGSKTGLQAYLENIVFENLNTINVTDMTGMFYNCSYLVSLDLSSFNTSNVTGMTQMFSGCSYLVSLDLSSFNTSNVTDMTQMFYFCRKLITIYASDGFTTGSLESGRDIYMFYYCSVLVGGEGTVCSPFDYTKTGAEYARIDGGTAAPGYFTEKQ